MSNKMTDLINCFKEAKESGSKYIAMYIRVPDAEKQEVIINSRENFDVKLEYYQKTYDEDLYHNAVGDILRIDDFTHGNSFAEIEESLFKGGDNE